MLDVLAIGAHPDDCEIAMAGTICVLKQQSYKVGICDLTAGEAGTYGSAETRKQESQATADKPELKKGRNPDYPRRWRVDLRSRAQLAAELAAASTQKSPMQRMQEAVAALDQAGPGSLPST